MRSPGLSLASGFEHPTSTLPTRFPAALGIGYGLPAAQLMLRISIRRCLSMLRNTGDGNEQAMPLSMPTEKVLSGILYSLFLDDGLSGLVELIRFSGIR